MKSSDETPLLQTNSACKKINISSNLLTLHISYSSVSLLMSVVLSVAVIFSRICRAIVIK